MLSNLVAGFAAILNFQTILLMLAGMAGGLLVGALPGLTATMAVAIMVSLTFGLTGTTALAMLLSIYLGAVSGGFVSAILINTPGTPASIATTFDGYPMARKGLAGKALGLAFMASLVGSIIGIVALVLLAPFISRAALRFSAPEYFAIAVFGLAMIIGISGKDLAKGAFSGVVGLLIATVGLDPVTGVARFDLGNVNLLGGFSFVPVVIGLFAISEALYQATQAGRASQVKQSVRSIFPKMSTLWLHKWLILKSGVIGTFIGALPGTGADIASLVSYTEAKRSSRHPELFGKGAEEGVIASETANNAVPGAAMIPLLTLAIPGDAVTAVLLGALRMHNLQPGPLLFRDHIHQVYALYAALLLGVVMLRVVGAVVLPWFARIMNLPRPHLVAAILLFSFVGSYAINNSVFDMGAAVAFGILGFIMLRFDYPVGPMVLALILGPIAEDRMRTALVMSQGSWAIFVTRPISAVFLALSVAALVFMYRQHRNIAKLERDMQRAAEDLDSSPEAGVE
ncbi:MAG TPA: tripartite tricarboxylate transporter permease [Trueperaceae bacterium]|nr:tripartite tricarboxylate transporter permease [Trueperaceae bacterium]